MTLTYTDLYISGVFAGRDVWHDRQRLGSIKPAREGGGWNFYLREAPGVATQYEPVGSIDDLQAILESEWSELSDEERLVVASAFDQPDESEHDDDQKGDYRGG